MRMSEVRGKMRVRLSDEARQRHTLPTDVQIDLKRTMLIVREGGTLTSGRILSTRPGYEEGLFVRVKWDGLPTPESWHLIDLVPAPEPTPQNNEADRSLGEGLPRRGSPKRTRSLEEGESSVTAESAQQAISETPEGEPR